MSLFSALGLFLLISAVITGICIAISMPDCKTDDSQQGPEPTEDDFAGLDIIVWEDDPHEQD